MNKVLILCPLTLELNFLISGFKDLGYETEGVEHDFFKIQNTPYYLSLGGHGKVNFAINTIDKVNLIKPTAVFCIGSAGALDTKLNVGDVIVGENTIEHDYNLKFIKSKLPKLPGALEFLQRFREKTSAIFGDIASGDEDIIDIDRATEIKNKTHALAVAWEGAGGAKAAKFKNTSYIEIRGISDHPGSNNFEDFKKNLELVMSNIAKTLIDVL